MSSPAFARTSCDTLPEERFTPCCFPSGACLIGASVDITCEESTGRASNGTTANKMYCTNASCDQTKYMHTHCLEQLENQLAQQAKKLASESSKSGRGGAKGNGSKVSGMSDKQIRQNIWNFKPEFDQLYSSLSCKCGKGHVTRDPSSSSSQTQLGGGEGDGDYVEEPFQIVSSGGKRGVGGGVGGGKKRGGGVFNTSNSSNTSFNSRQGGGGGVANKIQNSHHAQPKQISRIRNSLSASDMSTAAGSVPSNSPGGGGGGNTASSSPGSSAIHPSGYSPDSMSPRSASGGQYFSGGSSKWGGVGGANHSSPPTSGRLGRRTEFSSLQTTMDPYRYNIFHVKVEEDLPSDEFKDALFQTLRSRSLNTLTCLICAKRLLVYDRYPLVDGCAFLSPVKHHQDEHRSLPFHISPNIHSHASPRQHQFVSCVCVKCLQGGGVGGGVVCICCHCGKEWVGSSFQIGVIYPFDIFAANICCSERSKCSHCEKQLLTSTRPLPQRYAEFSLSFPCPSCQQSDWHFVRPIHRLFNIQQ